MSVCLLMQKMKDFWTEIDALVGVYNMRYAEPWRP